MGGGFVEVEGEGGARGGFYVARVDGVGLAVAEREGRSGWGG